MRIALVGLACAAALAACGDTLPATSADSAPSGATTPPTGRTADIATTLVGSRSTTTTTTTTTTTATTTTTTTSSRSSSTVPAVAPATSTTALVPSTEARSGTTPYVVPLADASAAGWGDTHSSYPATDIFNNGCGGAIVSPVNGVLLEVRRVNGYDPAVDNPATRGGRSVSILGDDGVRYYFAHFELVDDTLEPGDRVDAGVHLGTIGSTGRSSACHVHFGISPPCPDREWSVRRGVVWPYPYLDDWRSGGQASPFEEVSAFVAEHPNACAEASADPNAADA